MNKISLKYFKSSSYSIKLNRFKYSNFKNRVFHNYVTNNIELAEEYANTIKNELNRIMTNYITFDKGQSNLLFETESFLIKTPIIVGETNKVRVISLIRKTGYNYTIYPLFIDSKHLAYTSLEIGFTDAEECIGKAFYKLIQ